MTALIFSIAFAVLAIAAAIDTALNIYKSKQKPTEREVNLNIHRVPVPHYYQVIMQWYNTGSRFSKVVKADNPFDAVDAVTDNDVNKTYWVEKIEKV